MGGTPFGGLGAPNMDMAAMGLPGANMNPQVSSSLVTVTQTERVKELFQCCTCVVQALSADFLKLMQSMDPK